jgi:hypothetical protein
MATLNFRSYKRALKSQLYAHTQLIVILYILPTVTIYLTVHEIMEIEGIRRLPITNNLKDFISAVAIFL